MTSPTQDIVSGVTPDTSNPAVSPKSKVIAYIDGFNLYQGMRASRWRAYYWLDVRLLAQNLLEPTQELTRVRYFTANVVGNPEKERRQATYLDAIGLQPLVSITRGHYQAEPVRCAKCHLNWTIPKEKQTDVAIATAMMLDAHTGGHDVALLVTGDTDLIPPIKAIRDNFPAVRVVVAFPPNRFTPVLGKLAHGFIHINRQALAASQLPEQVRKPNGHVLKRPPKWAD